MAYTVLTPISQVIAAASQPVHKAYWPYPLIPALHAARISIAFRSQSRRTNGGAKLGWTQDMAGYLLMCWGGQLLVHILASQPPPMITSAAPWVVYPTVHLALAFLWTSLPSQKTLDSILFAVDALTRSAPIVAGVTLARNHPNILVNESLTAQIVFAALASAGGSAVASALNVWERDWRLSAPSAVKPGAGGANVLPATDVWAGALAGAVYSAATLAHPYWAKIFLDMGWRSKLDGAWCTDLEGRAIVVALLSIIYLWRVAQTHYGEQIGEVKVKHIDNGVAAQKAVNSKKDR